MIPAMVCVESGFGAINAPLELHRKLDGNVPPDGVTDGVGVGVGVGVPEVVVHRWLLWPLQVHKMT
ncbi:hypothetical protein, partial [Microbispora corallina]|uniref:hypothetical protein n=1 Tax=Microbispora corallina TaxID=83302 RepID=UPI0031D43F59